MRIEGGIFAMGAIFFWVVGAAYWFLSGDEIGTTAIVMTGFLAGLVSVYLLVTAKRVYPRPEDRNDAEIEEADPEYGFFSPHSWWPLVVAFGSAVIVMGLVFAVWLIVFGVFLLMIALVGWLYEYYRGSFAQ